MVLLRVLLVLFLCAASTGLKQINVESAKSVRLQCQGPENDNITLLEWKRHDLLSDGYVFFYRDGRPHESFQHPIFKDRVELSDPQMKNGDMSIILYNTTIKDSGTYECRIIVRKARDRNRATAEIKHHIYLSVVAPPGQPGGYTEDGGKVDGRKEDERKEDGKKEDGKKEDGSVRLKVGLSVAAVLLVATVVGFCLSVCL